jgi:hypothetical protein
MRLSAHFGQWREVRRRGQKVCRWQVAAGLIYGQVKKSYWRRKLVRVTHVMRLGTQADLKAARPRTGLLRAVEHGFYRASEFDRPTWGGRSRTSHLGYFPTGSTAAGPSGMVACVLPFCASSRITSSGAAAATRTRWQTAGATLSATDSGDGSRENHPTMDGSRGALLPIVAGFRLRATEARWGCSVMLRASR